MRLLFAALRLRSGSCFSSSQLLASLRLAGVDWNFGFSPSTAAAWVPALPDPGTLRPGFSLVWAGGIAHLQRGAITSFSGAHSTHRGIVGKPDGNTPALPVNSENKRKVGLVSYAR